MFRRESGSLAFRLASYPALNNAAFASTGPLLMTLVAVAALPVLASNVVSLTALAAVRFLICDRVIWRNRAATADAVDAGSARGIASHAIRDHVEQVSVAA